MPTWEWKIPGAWYHAHKWKFQKAREEYIKLGNELIFTGFHDMGWANDKEKIRLIAERFIDDDGKEKTKELKVYYESNENTWLLAEMLKIFKGFEVNRLGEELRTFDDFVDEEIQHMMSANPPAPEQWIQAHIRKRLRERRELLEKFGAVERQPTREEIFGF